MSLFLAYYITLHEMMHATVLAYAQFIIYGPEACKILARTVRICIAKDGITVNG
jgi:hypothetical protein